MRNLLPAALCLVCSAGLAQAPVPPPSAPPITEGVRPLPLGPTVTETSRIRAFSSGPDGQVKSLFLANGTVVETAGNFGPGFNPQVHKGVRVRIVGNRGKVNGQATVTARQVTLNQQNFAAVAPGPAGLGLRAEWRPENPGAPSLPPVPEGPGQDRRRSPLVAGGPPPPPPPPCDAAGRGRIAPSPPPPATPMPPHPADPGVSAPGEPTGSGVPPLVPPASLRPD